MRVGAGRSSFQVAARAGARDRAGALLMSLLVAFGAQLPLASVSVSTATASSDVTSGLVGYWTFDSAATWGRNEVVAGTRYGDLTSATSVAVSTGDKPARPGNVGALAFAVGQLATGSDTPNVDLSTAVSVATGVKRWLPPGPPIRAG